MPYDADIGHEEVENQVDHNEGLIRLAQLLEIGIVSKVSCNGNGCKDPIIEDTDLLTLVFLSTR